MRYGEYDQKTFDNEASERRSSIREQEEGAEREYKIVHDEENYYNIAYKGTFLRMFIHPFRVKSLEPYEEFVAAKLRVSDVPSQFLSPRMMGMLKENPEKTITIDLVRSIDSEGNRGHWKNLYDAEITKKL